MSFVAVIYIGMKPHGGQGSDSANTKNQFLSQPVFHRPRKDDASRYGLQEDYHQNRYSRRIRLTFPTFAFRNPIFTLSGRRRAYRKAIAIIILDRVYRQLLEFLCLVNCQLFSLRAGFRLNNQTGKGVRVP